MWVKISEWRAAKLLIGVFAVLAFSNTANAEDIVVPVDESAVYVFDKDISTVAIANPSIANVSVHNRRIILVQGRAFGTTNVIALDQDGHPVASKRIRVGSAAGSGNVTMIRGSLNGLVSYNCSPNCERVLMVGDESSTTAAFDKVASQSQTKNSIAENAVE